MGALARHTWAPARRRLCHDARGPMSPRPTPVLLVATLALGLVGCASIPAAPVGAVPSADSRTGDASPVAAIERQTPSSAAAPTLAPTANPDNGNVEAPVTPGLSVEPLGASTIRVTLADPVAKAWQLTVSGAGAGAGTADSWALNVETGDVAPVITTVETINGVVGEPRERAGLEAGARTGRVCSVAVAVCLRGASVVLPRDGNGTLVLELGRTDANAALWVTGATAAWPAEPFVLGPWTTTSAFPWGP